MTDILIPMGKNPRSQESIQALVKHMEATITQPIDKQVIGISHGDCIKDVEYLQQLVTVKIWSKELPGELR